MATYNDAQPYLNALASDRGLNLSDQYDRDDPLDTDGINNPLPFLRWCIYEGGWEDGPGDGWVNGSNPLYLRTPLRTDYIYGGAVTKATFYANPETISDRYEIHSYDSERLITENPAWSRGKDLETSSLAKPLGTLGNGLAPSLATMVLPVFSRARLIPIAMQDPGDNMIANARLWALRDFLEWLADVDDIDNPATSPPAGTWFFLTCLQDLNNVEWRSKGWNRDFIQDELPTTPYDPVSNPTGAGWLQMGYAYEYDEDGVPIGIIRTNEDTCDYWPGGPGPGGGGPPILH